VLDEPRPERIEQRFKIGEVAIDRALADAGGLSDRRIRHVDHFARTEHRHDALEDRFAGLLALAVAQGWGCRERGIWFHRCRCFCHHVSIYDIMTETLSMAVLPPP